ncbi:uncharacterized protein LOC115215825 [Argonauta hians]
MEENICRYDSGIDASTLTFDISSMSLNSFDSTFNSVDVLNRARIYSIDHETSTRDDLNEAQFLSQDITLDNTDSSQENNNSVIHVVPVGFQTSPKKKPVHNKENIRNNNNNNHHHQYRHNHNTNKSSNNNNAVNHQIMTVKTGQNGIKTNASKRNEANGVGVAQKTTPLSPRKATTQNSSVNANNFSSGSKKGPYNKQTVPKPKVTPPKSPKQTCKDYCQPQFNSPQKQHSLQGQKKPGKFKNNFQNSTPVKKVKVNPTCAQSTPLQSTPPHRSPLNDSLEDSDTSIYHTPLQTPSKLETFSPSSRQPGEALLNSPNVTVRSRSPYRISPNVTVRTHRQTSSPNLVPAATANSSSNDLDALEYPLPHPHHSKTYFSPILDDSAIVEASCSGRTYISPPKMLNLEPQFETSPELYDDYYKTGPIKNLFADTKDSSPVFSNSPLANTIENLFESSGLLLQSPKSDSIDHSVEEFQNFLRKLEGVNKINGKRLDYNEPSPARDNSISSPLCCDSRPPDQLSEAELDEITWIHTTCNGQPVAPRVSIDLLADDFAVFPPPRTPRHLKWNDCLEQDCSSAEKQSPNPSTPLKPILRKRPKNHVFPYNGDNPSPYMLTKTRHVNILV